MNELRIPYTQLLTTMERILLDRAFSPERAHLCASLFAKASLDGVASHGLNRFPAFLQMIEQGHVLPEAEPSLTGGFGPFERWDGNRGPGPLNAHQSMERAISLSQTHGMGCVALRNTNHWMRGGNYGWQAVDKGCIGICFTNTKPNMPAWGGSEPILGNNPLVMAVPRRNGSLVLDMAMSQFSYGKISTYLRDNKQLPYDGGFDASGELTRNPRHILEKELALPIGLWKGAGLSLLLDVLASVLSEGKTTPEVGTLTAETGLSQVFVCFDPARLGITDYPEDKLDALIGQLKSSSTFEGSEVRFPGERTLATRAANLEKGVPVEKAIWEKVLAYKESGMGNVKPH